MKRLGLILAFLLALAAPASAQVVVAACQTSTAIYAAGQQNRLFTIDVYGNLCTNGTGGGGGGGSVTVTNLNPNGQASSANSSPVVIANDQSAIPVIGSIADGSTDSGASVKIGGQVNTTGGQTALTSGQRSFWWMGARGSGATFLTALNGNPVADVAVTSVDGVSTGLGALKVQSMLYGFNSTTWDRIKSTSGNLNVQCANCSGSGASAADAAAFTAGTSVFAPAGGFFQTTATNSPLTTGQQGLVQMTAQRAFFINLRNSSGTEIGTAAAAVRVDPTGTTTQPVSLAAETTKVIGTVRNVGNLGAVFDFAGQNAASPANATLSGCQFNTTPTTITSGNASPFQCATDGSLLVTVKSATGLAQGSTTSSQSGSLVMGAVQTVGAAVTNGNTNALSIDPASNLRTAAQGAANVTPADCSGTVTAGGTAQNAHTAQAALHGMQIANLDTTEVMWISFTTTAAANTVQSFPLAPATATTFANLSSYTTPVGFGYNTALSVVAATTGHKWSCTRW